MSRTPGWAHERTPPEQTNPLHTRRMQKAYCAAQRRGWREDGGLWVVSKQSRYRRTSQSMKPVRSKSRSSERELDESM